jgi:hypothetical protein
MELIVRNALAVISPSRPFARELYARYSAARAMHKGHHISGKKSIALVVFRKSLRPLPLLLVMISLD